MIYKHVTFGPFNAGGKTCYCSSTHGHHDILGTVEYNFPWKCYVFVPADSTEFSADCLKDIADFLERSTTHANKKTLPR